VELGDWYVISQLWLSSPVFQADRIGNAHETTSTTYANSQEKRTWLRKLFEAQLAAYTPNGPNQPSSGWYYWTCEPLLPS
jgi:hypothetical protein